MGSTGFPAGAIAQEKERGAALGSAQAEAPAGGEIEGLGDPADIGNDAGDGLAGKGFLGDPEQVLHIGSAHEDKLGRIQAKREQARSIGQAKELGVVGQLEIEQCHAPGIEQGPGLTEGKAEAGAAIAHGIGKNLLEKATGQARKAPIHGRKRAGAGFRQRRFSLDIGNGFPQRGEALLVIRGLHDLTAT